jgi:hypothetical protein
MARATELRIGNIVNTEYGILSVHASMLLDIANGDFKVEGVELSPEILEKIGFVGWKRSVSLNMGYEGGDIFFGIPDGHTEARGGQYPKYKHGFIIGCVLGKKISEEEYECTYWYNRGGSKKGTEIKHLHQLQNLIFSLTGKEIEVKF